jgi:hypothetical protein
MTRHKQKTQAQETQAQETQAQETQTAGRAGQNRYDGILQIDC